MTSMLFKQLRPAHVSFSRMFSELAGTKTHANLIEAFTGESMVRAKKTEPCLVVTERD